MTNEIKIGDEEIIKYLIDRDGYYIPSEYGGVDEELKKQIEIEISTGAIYQ